MGNSILLIGTLDTKGKELLFIRDIIAEQGQDVLIADVGTGEPDESIHGQLGAHITNESVCNRVGLTLQDLHDGGRGFAVEKMTEAIKAVVQELYEKSSIGAVLGIGGSSGTTISSAAMRELPLGFPKLIVSTVASGETRQYVGTKDITMMYSVADISGLNNVSKNVFLNAALAISGMVKRGGLVGKFAETKPLIALSMFGVTTECVNTAQKFFEKRGYDTVAFHATGSGGQAMEELIKDGMITGVLDITAAEIGNHLYGGMCDAGPERMEIAGRQGIPQVVTCGAIDMVNFWTDQFPEKYKDRQIHQHNPSVLLMRTSADENIEIGEVIANKMNGAKGKTAFFVPLKGFSAIDIEGGMFYDPQADKNFVDSFKSHIDPAIEYYEFDMDINNEEFALAMATKLLEMLRSN